MMWESPVPAVSSVAQPVIIAILSLGSAGNAPAGEPVLEISGQAAPSVTPSTFYAFTPHVRADSGRKLHFSIRNLPSWARFGRKHGTVYGTPDTMNAGTYKNIVITVSDGEKTVDLPPFSITVAGGPQTPVASLTP